MESPLHIALRFYCTASPAASILRLRRWHHAASTDLVHWEDRGLGPVAYKETHDGMDADGTPCSGCAADGARRGREVVRDGLAGGAGRLGPFGG